MSERRRLESREDVILKFKNMRDDLRGLWVHIDLDSPDPKERREGTIESWDEGHIYVCVNGRGKPKKYNYKRVGLKYVQAEHDIIFDLPSKEEQERIERQRLHNEAVRQRQDIKLTSTEDRKGKTKTTSSKIKGTRRLTKAQREAMTKIQMSKKRKG